MAEDPTAAITFGLPSGPVPGPSHELTESERQQPGTMTVQAASGELYACYVAVDATTSLVGKPHIWNEADSTHINVVVGGPGATKRPKLSLGDDVVELAAKVRGAKTAVKWDSELRRWD